MDRRRSVIRGTGAGLHALNAARAERRACISGYAPWEAGRPPGSTFRGALDVTSVLVVSAIFMAAVIYGRDVLMPLSLAGVIAFALAPAVSWLSERRVPRAAAVVAVLAIVVGASLWGAAIFSAQVLSLTASLGGYKVNLAEKARALSPAVAGGSLQRAADSLSALQKEIEKQTRPRDDEIRVVAESEKDGGLAGILETARTAFGPLETALLTLVYVAVLLTGQYDLADRMVRLAGVENMSRTTAALATAGERLSKFFVRQTAINFIFGAITGAALGLLGIPNAILWGMGAAFMRFIPFVGVFIAAAPPLMLAAAVVPGWSLFLAVLALYLIAELLVANVVEPAVIGRHVGLSPLAFVAAGTFWWLVWGPVGLLLASPLTTVFVVLGEFFPQAEFVTLLFGDRPPLTPEQEYYHRLLAGDAASAAAIVHKGKEARAPLAAVDEVVIPALCVAAGDLRDRRISAERGEELAETVRAIADQIRREWQDEAARGREEAAPRIVLVPGHGPIDIAAGELIVGLLAEEFGVSAAAFHKSTGLLALSSLKADEEPEPGSLVLFSVGGLSASQLRHMAQRAHHLFPKARVIVFAREQVLALQAQADRIVQCQTLGQLGELLRIGNEDEGDRATSSS